MLRLPTTISPHQRTFLTLCIALLGSATVLVDCASAQPNGSVDLVVDASMTGLREGAEELVAQLY